MPDGERPENGGRGVKATVGPDGMTLDRINIGSYGQVPDYWPYENDAPRGSHPNEDNYLPGSYTIFEKSEVWAEGVDVLYEDAIRDRWIPDVADFLEIDYTPL